MAKIISAQSILKQKGYVQNKFDTNGFMQAVGEFFLANSVESKLLLLPYRFLDIKVDKDNDPCQLIKKEDIPNLSELERMDMDAMDRQAMGHASNPYGINWESRLLGYKAQTEMDRKENYPAWAVELSHRDWEAFMEQQKAGLDKPRVIIDKPFFENAAATLRLMGGYVVEKQVKKHRNLYWVTLI